VAQASDPVIPDAVWYALSAARDQAAEHPARHAAYDGQAGFAASTRQGSPSYYRMVSKAHSEGSMATALTRSAHIHNRHIPLKDR
jgi:hypothetical protein